MHQSEYEQLEGWNFSRLKLMRTSALHFLNPPVRKMSASLIFGLALHCLVLEPEEFTAKYEVYKGKSRNNKGYKELVASTTKDVLLETEYEAARRAAKAVVNDKVAKQYLRFGQAETVLQWTDPVTGLKLKGRTDFVGDRQTDLKSTKNIDPTAWSYDAKKYCYPEQVAMYQDGLKALGYDSKHQPRWIVVENHKPYDVVVYRVPESVVEYGRKNYRKWLVNLISALETQDYTGTAAGQELEFVLPGATSFDSDDMPTMGGEEMF
jgi:exodeoxyribonuclease VIII